MIKYVAKFIVAINSNLGKAQIAAGFSWGLFLGLIPAGNLFWIAAFLLSFFFKHHHASKLLCMVILKALSALTAPLLDTVGWEVLHIEALQPLLTSLYNMPFVPFTKFNNTLVAGGIVSGIVLWLPVFFLMLLLVPLYRHTLAPKIRESKIVKAIKNVPFVSKLQKLAAKIMNAQIS
ncbi:MAG: TIGR03546 family protein [Treponema sp.]|nr:TIGR03546 family protein [Treponema sp.]